MTRCGELHGRHTRNIDDELLICIACGETVMRLDFDELEQDGSFDYTIRRQRPASTATNGHYRSRRERLGELIGARR